MKHAAALIALVFALASCHESLEDRAAREAKEYTAKYCPTPFVNDTRTDSVAFDKASRAYIYYCTFRDTFDDPAVIARYRAQLHDALLQSIARDTKTKAYKDAGFTFAYVCRSLKRPGLVLYHDRFTPKDYNATRPM